MTDQPDIAPQQIPMTICPQIPVLQMIGDRAVRLDRIIAVEPRETRHATVVLECHNTTERVDLHGVTVEDVLDHVTSFNRAVMENAEAHAMRQNLAAGVGKAPPRMAKGTRPGA